MKRVKGCLNSNCSEYKKTYYSATDQYCIKCGIKLNYVCKDRKCFKQLPDDAIAPYCSVHLAERQDKREKHSATAKKVGIGAVAVVGTLAATGKAIISIIKKE